MAHNEDAVINEPGLDASSCSIFPHTADEIKFHYKLKYPGIYSIPTSRVLDLLDNDVLFSHLKNSVNSFVYHAREVHKIDKMCSNATLNSTEASISGTGECENNSDVLTSTPENITADEADVLDIPAPPTDFAVYDSVHSIKVPWRTYEKVKGSRRTFFRRKKTDPSEAFGDMSKTSQRMTGVVFERIVKPAPDPLKYKYVAPTTQEENKEESETLTPCDNNQQINDLTT